MQGKAEKNRMGPIINPRNPLKNEEDFEEPPGLELGFELGFGLGFGLGFDLETSAFYT